MDNPIGSFYPCRQPEGKYPWWEHPTKNWYQTSARQAKKNRIKSLRERKKFRRETKEEFKKTLGTLCENQENKETRETNSICTEYHKDPTKSLSTFFVYKKMWN